MPNSGPAKPALERLAEYVSGLAKTEALIATTTIPANIETLKTVAARWRVLIEETERELEAER